MGDTALQKHPNGTGLPNDNRIPNGIGIPNGITPLTEIATIIEELHACTEKIKNFPTLNNGEKDEVIRRLISGGGGLLGCIPLLTKYADDDALRKFMLNPTAGIHNTLENANDTVIVHALQRLGYITKKILVHHLRFDKNTAVNCLRRLAERGIIIEATKDDEDLLKFKALLELTSYNFQEAKFYRLTNIAEQVFSSAIPEIPSDAMDAILNLEKRLADMSLNALQEKEKIRQIRQRSCRDATAILSRSAKGGHKKIINLAEAKGVNRMTVEEAETLLGSSSSAILQELMKKGLLQGEKLSDNAVNFKYFYLVEVEGEDV